ncbi:MAG: hypothetical protein JO096_00120, partial [Alphaproteobacteria bacterium]|nr:hypothetical protein [Alphaproteobacteria bacterium]
MDAPEDEAARLLDLAAYADDRLDVEERERVAALLADDQEASADVRAARALAGGEQAPAGIERIIARAVAISPGIDAAPALVIPFAPRRGRAIEVFAEWGSIAAALALASWLGFAMGSDTSRALVEPQTTNDTTLLPELFDPAPGFLR